MLRSFILHLTLLTILWVGPFGQSIDCAGSKIFIGCDRRLLENNDYSLDALGCVGLKQVKDPISDSNILLGKLLGKFRLAA